MLPHRFEQQCFAKCVFFMQTKSWAHAQAGSKGGGRPLGSVRDMQRWCFQDIVQRGIVNILILLRDKSGFVIEIQPGVEKEQAMPWRAVYHPSALRSDVLGWM